MESITQAEFDKKFAEYAKDKTLDTENYLGHLIAFTKLLESQGLTVRAGFSVDVDGVVHEKG